MPFGQSEVSFGGCWLCSWSMLGRSPILKKMPFGDALYFTLVTGTTIGYGDLTPVTPIGRVVAILTGLQGLLITGLITAVAVYALRKSLEK